MRICLITPPSPFLLDQRVFASLGILKVGAVLEKFGYTVDHLDLSGVTNYEEVVRNYSGEAKIFAISATTPQMPYAAKIRKCVTGKVILGGPHATLVHAAAKRGSERARTALQSLLSEFDCVVAGDGEKAIFTALYSKGLIDADDPKSVYWNTSADFTNSPWPARHLIDVGSYHYEIDGRRATHVITQLGCPMACRFCSGRNSPMLRRIRTRPIDSVIDEILYLHKTYGYTAYNFFDDELNVNRSMVDLMRELRKVGDKIGVDWRFRGFVKAELFNEEQAEAMYAAGFRWLLCGFESAHPKILKNINKIATVEDNTAMLRTAHKAGIKVKALMSLGHPGDSSDTIKATQDWLINERPDDFDATVITLYPGSPYWDDSIPIGGTTYRYDTNGDALYSEHIDYCKDAAYYKGISGEYHSFVWTDYLTREDLVKFRDALEDYVRTSLGIPYPSSAAAINLEHSMGMGLPRTILRSSR